MRTKTLVLSALVGLATAATSMAQVYSLNVVGYVNVPLTNGFNMICNPLDLDGTNYIANVFGTNLPQGSIVYTFDAVKGYTTANWNTNKSSKGVVFWDNPGLTNTAKPGQGLFVKIPVGKSVSGITFVGNVVQGGFTNTGVPAGAGGFGLISSQFPKSDYLTNFNYTPTMGDTVYTFDPKNGYTTYSYNTNKSSKGVVFWQAPNGCPVVNVGQGFYLKTGAAGEKWTNNFIVQ